MRHGLLSVVACGVGLAVRLSGAELASGPAAQEGTGFLRNYAQTRGFSLGRPTRAQPAPDGKTVLFLRSQPRVATLHLFEFDVQTAQTRELLTPEQVLGDAKEVLSPEEKARRERMRVTAGGFTDFQLSRDGSQVLLSLGGKLFVFDRRTGKTRSLATGDGVVLDPHFSPDGSRVAYVREHDLCVYDLVRNKEKQLTAGGRERLTHGLAEFVAQEEMDRFSGYWWSPDSRSLAYEEADASGVEIWHVSDPAKPGQAGMPSYYPRPGKANVRVRLGIISVRGGKTTWVRWDASKYPYMARVDWSDHGELTVAVQTRDQSELSILQVKPDTGETRSILSEQDPAWVNLDQDVPRWLSDGTGFLWTTERTGGWQLELHSSSGALVRVLVGPELGYQGLSSVDERAGVVYFHASADPTQSKLWSVPLQGGPPRALSQERGLHGASYAKDFSVHTHSIANLEGLPRTVIERADGSVAGELPSVAEPPPWLPRMELVEVEREPKFHAKVIRPRRFESGGKLPVLVNVYGGPHANMVRADISSQWLNQWLADQGFIVVSLDGRGTPGRGRNWERAIRKAFGSVPLDDQVAGLEALALQVPEMDLNRVGIFGWSFGGYMSALAVMRRPDIFKAGVAGAPVVDWLDYDTHYTERYLGLPDASSAAYTEGSLLTYSRELKRPLLLVHGTADDNVYFRHSLRLADSLLRAGRDFEFLPLAGFTHMVPDPEVTEQLWLRVAAFFKSHL